MNFALKKYDLTGQISGVIINKNQTQNVHNIIIVDNLLLGPCLYTKKIVSSLINQISASFQDYNKISMVRTYPDYNFITFSSKWARSIISTIPDTLDIKHVDNHFLQIFESCTELESVINKDTADIVDKQAIKYLYIAPYKYDFDNAHETMFNEFCLKNDFEIILIEPTKLNKYNLDPTINQHSIGIMEFDKTLDNYFNRQDLDLDLNLDLKNCIIGVSNSSFVHTPLIQSTHEFKTKIAFLILKKEPAENASINIIFPDSVTNYNVSNLEKTDSRLEMLTAISNTINYLENNTNYEFVTYTIKKIKNLLANFYDLTNPQGEIYQDKDIDIDSMNFLYAKEITMRISEMHVKLNLLNTNIRDTYLKLIPTSDSNINSLFLTYVQNCKINDTTKITPINLTKLKNRFNANFDKLIENKLDFTNNNLKILNNDFGYKQFIEKHDAFFDLELENENPQYKKFIESCDFFNSVMSLTNWYDEIKNNSIMGLLCKLTISPLCKLGVSGSKIQIDNITTSYFPLEDYLAHVIQHFNRKNLPNHDFGNLNNEIIINGTAIGDGNSIVPLYINKYHWKIAQNYSDPLFGTIISHNPLTYTKTHSEFMFVMLIEMTRRLFVPNATYILSETSIRTYFALYRTCAEICFDKGYIRGIKSYIQQYMTNIEKRHKVRPFDTDVMLGQILSSGYKFSNMEVLNDFIEIIYEQVIRFTTIKKHEVDKYVVKHKDMRDVAASIDKNTSSVVEILGSFYKMYEMLQTHIYKESKSYNQLLKVLDENYGLLPMIHVMSVFNFVCSNKLEKNLTYNHLYKIRNINNDSDSLFIFYILRSLKYPSLGERTAMLKESDPKYYLNPEPKSELYPKYFSKSELEEKLEPSLEPILEPILEPSLEPEFEPYYLKPMQIGKERENENYNPYDYFYEDYDGNPYDGYENAFY